MKTGEALAIAVPALFILAHAASPLWSANADFSNFNISRKLWNEVIVIDSPGGESFPGKALKVEFPRGGYASQAGFGGKPGGLTFYAKPGVHIFNRDSVGFSYEIFFPRNFDWVKGGKLPGLYSKFNQSGGNETTGFSYCLLWRAGGLVQAYTYVYAAGRPDEVTEFVPGILANGTASVQPKIVTLLAGQWNTVKMYMKLNSIRQEGGLIANGVLQLSINGRLVVGFNQMVWRTGADLQIEGILFQAFYGGNDASYAPTADTFIAFKNLQLTEL